MAMKQSFYFLLNLANAFVKLIGELEGKTGCFKVNWWMMIIFFDVRTALSAASAAASAGVNVRGSGRDAC